MEHQQLNKSHDSDSETQAMERSLQNCAARQGSWEGKNLIYRPSQSQMETREILCFREVKANFELTVDTDWGVEAH